MARHKVLVIVPFPLSEKGMANRRAQLAGQIVDSEIEFEFIPVKSSGALLDSNTDFLQLDVAIYEAGIDAERKGYSAVCIDTVSDSGMNALRARLSIPVIGPGQAMFHLACQLGKKFSILSMSDGTVAVVPLYRKLLAEYELAHRCASIRLATQDRLSCSAQTGGREVSRDDGDGAEVSMAIVAALNHHRLGKGPRETECLAEK
jgi:allantoin racemase